MEIISWIKSLLIDYGAVNVIIMFLVILLTNIVKKPIMTHADKVVGISKNLGFEIDKSVITSNIIYIPIGIAFILYFIYALIINSFNFAAIDFANLFSTSVVYGMLSISIYDIGKNKLKAYVSKDKYKEVKKILAEEKEKEKQAENDLLQD